MNLRWLRITLRVAAAALLVVAVFTLVFGGFSLHTQEQATPNGFSVDHVVGIGHIPLLLLFVSVVLLVLSFVIPPRRV
jgi:hypothetical protein